MPPEFNPYQAPATDVAAYTRLPAFDLPLASPWARLAARFLDNVLLYGGPGVVFVLGSVLSGGAKEGGDLVLVVVMGLTGLVYLAIGVLFLWMLHDSGQTPGKKALGIRIVSEDGGPADFAKIVFLRMMAPFLIGVFCSLFGLVDSLMIIGSDRRCLHDHMAGTRVVDV